MSDRIETFGNSVVQHGAENDRAYLMKVKVEDCPALIDFALDLAAKEGYSKIFAKVPEPSRQAFLDREFVEEAAVPNLFNGRTDGFFCSKYLDPARRRESEPETLEQAIEAAQAKFTPEPGPFALEDGYQWRIMQKDDVGAMTVLYKEVFASYPFPIHDPDYLAGTMDDNIVYHGIWHGDRLVALSSAEIDFDGENVEMTDFATQPDYRGKGLASYLLARMEEDVRRNGIQTAYTIARSYSFGMNITFAKHGYRFAGTLTSNTQISGRLESMNVWYKPL